MAFNLPRGEVVPVSSIEVRLDPAPHEYEVANAEAIEANWKREVAANPALFDGSIVLLSEVSYEGGRLIGRCNPVRYATLLAWRRERGAEAEHAYAHAALVSNDGALVAIRMGAHTANPGRVYFAAGSFEEEDFRDGLVDTDANMEREVQEETGLDIAGARKEDGYHLFSRDGQTVIFRCYFLDEPADCLAERISAHVAAEEEPEIEGPVIIRGKDNLPDGIAPHMGAIVEWYFEGRKATGE
jgi:8-oxo-dGTP pyrophosphatase MutT (NUDIX family)